MVQDRPIKAYLLICVFLDAIGLLKTALQFWHFYTVTIRHIDFVKSGLYAVFDLSLSSISFPSTAE